jgi:hypothetical protein
MLDDEHQLGKSMDAIWIACETFFGLSPGRPSIL